MTSEIGSENTQLYNVRMPDDEVRRIPAEELLQNLSYSYLSQHSEATGKLCTNAAHDHNPERCRFVHLKKDLNTRTSTHTSVYERRRPTTRHAYAGIIVNGQTITEVCNSKIEAIQHVLNETEMKLRIATGSNAVSICPSARYYVHSGPRNEMCGELRSLGWKVIQTSVNMSAEDFISQTYTMSRNDEFEYDGNQITLGHVLVVTNVEYHAPALVQRSAARVWFVDIDHSDKSYRLRQAQNVLRVNYCETKPMCDCDSPTCKKIHEIINVRDKIGNISKYPSNQLLRTHGKDCREAIQRRTHKSMLLCEYGPAKCSHNEACHFIHVNPDFLHN